MQLTATESRNRQQRSRQQRRQRQWRCMQREPTRPPSGDAPPRGRAGVPREGPKTGKAVASLWNPFSFCPFDIEDIVPPLPDNRPAFTAGERVLKTVLYIC